ncbi:MAG: helix-turn-helix domain-containing protein [Candidatus Planktophila sp.]|jgi:transcriptional regulator with XRE-family HTH domain|nr:helix-turn-helix domain-containing protein [Candidatus Planktophila sp.]
MSTHNELVALQSRLRAVRVSKGLTLAQVSSLSKGSISAIALGSYERGDRSLSTQKLFEISQIYGVPVVELLSSPSKGIDSGRVIIDLRKLSKNQDPSTEAPLKIIQRIAAMRHDWNGEVISLRSTDVTLLKIFADYSEEEIGAFLQNFALAKLK